MLNQNYLYGSLQKISLTENHVIKGSQVDNIQKNCPCFFSQTAKGTQKLRHAVSPPIYLIVIPFVFAVRKVFSLCALDL